MLMIPWLRMITSMIPDDPHDETSSPLRVGDICEEDCVEVCMAEPVMTWPDNQLGLEDSQEDGTLFYEPAEPHEPDEPHEPASTAPSGSDASGGTLSRASPLDLNMVDLVDSDGEMEGACLNSELPCSHQQYLITSPY